MKKEETPSSAPEQSQSSDIRMDPTEVETKASIDWVASESNIRESEEIPADIDFDSTNADYVPSLMTDIMTPVDSVDERFKVAWALKKVKNLCDLIDLCLYFKE